MALQLKTVYGYCVATAKGLDPLPVEFFEAVIRPLLLEKQTGMGYNQLIDNKIIIVAEDKEALSRGVWIFRWWDGRLSGRSVWPWEMEETVEVNDVGWGVFHFDTDE